MPTINGTNITAIGAGEGDYAFDVTVTTTTATDTTVSATLTFGRPFIAVPNFVSARITSSAEDALGKVGIHTLTATSCTVYIRQETTAMTAEAKTVRVVLKGQLL